MDILFSRQRKLLENVSTDIVRDILNEINWEKRLISIRGNRGVGKTTLLLQYVKLEYGVDTTEALYCSLDSLYFSSHTILELAEEFSLMGGKHLLLDEVHKYAGWSREIKEIYDSFPDMKVVISGSSLLHIINADADLSRRCRPYEMYGLSFREYLRFYHGLTFPRCTLTEVLERADAICSEICSVISPIPLFRKYLTDGYYPFFHADKEDYYIALENIVNFVVDQELTQICNVEPAYTRKIKALLQVIADSVPFELDVKKVGTMLELNRNTVITYLNHLDNAGLIRSLYSDLLTIKKMQKPDKIFINDTNMLCCLAHIDNEKAGTMRETFVVSQLAVNHQVEYGKDKGDFRVDSRYTFEVGGKEKSFAQIAGVPDSYILADDIELPIGHKLPIWLVGFIY